jgi:preprotein translocase subunit SecG
MVQNPKGGGLSSSFGGDSQQMGGVIKSTDVLENSTWFLAGALLLLILFSNITLNSGDQNSDSELINNNSDFEIEEILENDDSQNESE